MTPGASQTPPSQVFWSSPGATPGFSHASASSSAPRILELRCILKTPRGGKQHAAPDLVSEWVLAVVVAEQVVEGDAGLQLVLDPAVTDAAVDQRVGRQVVGREEHPALARDVEGLLEPGHARDVVQVHAEVEVLARAPERGDVELVLRGVAQRRRDLVGDVGVAGAGAAVARV